MAWREFAAFFLTAMSSSMSINSGRALRYSRREFLSRSYNGLGVLALGGLLAGELSASERSAAPPSSMACRPPHLAAKAKHCIFIFMAGGVSQMDTFDYKPALMKFRGQRLPDNVGVTGAIKGKLALPHKVFPSPFRFQPCGHSGRHICELFPQLGKCVDDLAFVYGIKVDNENHGPAMSHATTGHMLPGSPSVGSWISYGLGSPSQNLPGYAVIQDPRGGPVNDAAVWGNGYLPAAYQGTLLRSSGTPILNLTRPEGISRSQQRRELDLIKWLDGRHRDLRPEPDELEARIQAYELAFRMQQTAPELVDLSRETAQTRAMYGLDRPQTAGFGRQCLLARRLVERGVRYTLLVHGVQIAPQSWDDHGDILGRMRRHAAEVDQPIGALLMDLKQRGLLDETLVVWASEMGRTPFVPGENLPANAGRDHNQYGLAMWLAGGDVRGGATAGATDEFGLRSAEEPIPIRDVHATILRLMGLDDTQLSYLHAGRFRRLTDIGGRVLRPILAT